MQKENTTISKWDAAPRSEVYAHTKRVASKHSRKCATCGKPTNDYRCPKCWAKLRAESGLLVHGDFDEDIIF